MAILLNMDPDYPVTPEHHAYWAALGRFIHRFAMMEQQFHFLLRLTSKTDDAASKAIFSGTRAKQAISWFDRINEARGHSPDADFERAKAQFNVINQMRDDIVHSGAILYQDGFLISNEQRTIARQVRITPVSVADLESMTADLDTIAATVFIMQLVANDDEPSAYFTDWREVGRSAWQYKLPPLVSSHRKTREATLAQSDPLKGKPTK